MKINPSQIKSFLNNLANNSELKGLLIYGADKGLVREHIKFAKHKYLLAEITKNSEEKLNSNFLQQTDINATDLKKEPYKLFEAAFSISLLGDFKKVVLIRETNDFLTQLLEKYFLKADSQTLVIIEAAELPPSSSLRLWAEKSRVVATIPCYLDDLNSLKNLINSLLAKNKFSISSSSLNYMVNNLGADRGVTLSELNKLMLYKHGSSQIELIDVEKILEDSGVISFDKIVYAVFSGELELLFLHLQRSSNDLSPITLIRSLISHINKLFYVKTALLQNKDLNLTLKSLKPPVFFTFIDAFKKQVHHFSLTKMTQLLEKLNQAEINAKLHPNIAQTITENIAINICLNCKK